MATLTGFHINSSTLSLPPSKCYRKGVNVSLPSGRLRIASSLAIPSSTNGFAVLTRKGERPRKGSSFVVRCQASSDGRVWILRDVRVGFASCSFLGTRGFIFVFEAVSFWCFVLNKCQYNGVSFSVGIASLNFNFWFCSSFISS